MANRKKIINNNLMIILFTILTIIIFSFPFKNFQNQNDVKMVMGGTYYIQSTVTDENTMIYKNDDVETYYRPSKLPVLNNRNYNISFLDDYYKKDWSKITLPDELFKTPEDMILNYFSILRDAANPEEGKHAGCGTIGHAMTPYPFAYTFLSSPFKEKLSFEQYLESFENILHLNLIKYKEIPVYNNSNTIRYFVEIETIEGSEKSVAYFGYYYGYVDLIKENDLFKISNLEFHGEDYLCAPMHGWAWDAEGVVDVKYGGWCSLVKERYPTQKEDYVKKIYFKGTDDNDYMIEFFQLTNDNDIEIAQYMKTKDEDWKLIKIDPEECLKEKNKR
ncbi:hypothetical protein EDD66_11542 [Mobilisporobacter senegalensis]|uniref:Uncharacterized protein n=1 Tax=Mobilisporobacter senegalensis TaxID=1329262 RepID=A0A3N1XC68_9FIRM|nr:hypothetical protein [Mobilisporobacter senegalensis]ROR22357.1 hypothetical protein EDD66_11542 [Mobilisporobacter senegalensis]